MEHQAIVATVMDYFEGWFDGDATRMERALHTDLAKRGVRTDKTGAQVLDSMTAAQMIAWTREGEGKVGRPADLSVDAVYEQIATVTVHSAVFIEYVQLMHTPAGWRIVNTLFMKRK